MRAVTFRLLSRKPGPCLCVHQTDAELAYVVKTDKVVTRQQPVGKQRHAAENGQQKQQQQQQQQPTITGATKPAPIVASSPQRVALDGYTVAPPRTGHASGAAPDNTQGASPAVVYPSTPAARQLRQRQPPADRRSESSLTKQAPTHAKKTVANAARGQQPPHVRHAQHGQSSADDELQQQPGVQPQPAAASSSKPRGRHRDPGRAFMNAGIPPGLWVLPVSASADAPPAPPPVAPEDPQALLEVSTPQTVFTQKAGPAFCLAVLASGVGLWVAAFKCGTVMGLVSQCQAGWMLPVVIFPPVPAVTLDCVTACMRESECYVAAVGPHMANGLWICRSKHLYLSSGEAGKPCNTVDCCGTRAEGNVTQYRHDVVSAV